MIFNLEKMPLNVDAQVLALDDALPHTPALRRLGLHEGIAVRLLSDGDPVMLRCSGHCLAVRRCMLGGVRVCCTASEGTPCCDTGKRSGTWFRRLWCRFTRP